MIKSCFGDMFDVVFKGEVAVEGDTKVTAVRGGGQSGVVNGEVEIFGCSEEGVWTNEYHV